MAGLRKKKENNTISVLVVIAFAVILLTVLYSCSIQQFFTRQAYSCVEQNAQLAKEQVDSEIESGISSIDFAGYLLSVAFKENNPDAGKEILDTFREKTPFAFLKYFNTDEFSEKYLFNEQAQYYYMEGIKKRIGIRLSFNGEPSENSTLDFSVPIYVDGKACGYLVGGMDIKESLSPLLEYDYYDKSTVSVLCDSSLNVISSNYSGIKFGSNLNDIKDCPAIDLLTEKVKADDESASKFEYKGGTYLGAVSKTESLGLYVLCILPKEAAEELSAKSFLFILLFILIFCVIIILYVFKSLKESSSIERMHVNIISALCASYQNVYVININSGAVFIYQLTERIRSNYGGRFAAGTYDEDFRLYEENEVYIEDRWLFDKVNEIGKIRKILETQKEYSFIYRVKSQTTGGKIHFYQCYYVRPEKSDEFVVTFKNVDDLMETKEKVDSLMQAQMTQLQIMSSISRIYLSLHLIDLEKDTIVEFNTTKNIKKYIFRIDRAAQQLKDTVKGLCVKEDIERGLQFTDLSTIKTRLHNVNYVSTELKSQTLGWIRVNFILVESDENVNPIKVLFAIQEINSEKKREEALIANANTDELTKLLNRHAYEEEMKKLEELEQSGKLSDDFVYISLDVNGLKQLNDSLGHEAGDELLQGASACIRNAFGAYGKIFRTGGDEFQVIMFANSGQLDRIKKNFEKDCKNWGGKHSNIMSVSYGIVTRIENLKRSAEAMVKLADKRMYRAKSDYYMKRGVDRRKTQEAMEILSKMYAKILMINLTTDTLSVIQIEADERDTINDYDGVASEWIKSFGNSNLIHDKDREHFLEETDFESLKKFFAAGGKNCTVYYARKIHGEFKNVQLDIVKASAYTPESELIYFFVRKEIFEGQQEL